MDINKNLSHVEFLNREYNVSHLSYERELAFFDSIKQGNLEEVMRLYKPLNSDEMGILSEDSLRNMKYHLIITVAFITRYCIEGGMEMETAYNMSDIYIQNIDKCTSVEQVQKLHKEVLEGYTKRMQSIRKSNHYSKAILLCLDYIYDNLHTKISLGQLANKVGLSETYLSKLFHKEVGSTICGYIIKKRIEAAENMLKFSDYSSTEISNYLCFSSESHFIHVFKKITGYTPKHYREQFFRTRWGV